MSQKIHNVILLLCLVWLMIWLSSKLPNIEIPAEPVALGNQINIENTQLKTVFQDSKDAYWFGSTSNGVFRYSNDTIIHFTTHDGLVSNRISSLQEDTKGNIYIETSEGIQKYDGNKLSTIEVLAASESTWELNETDLWFNCNGSVLYRYDGKVLHELQLPTKDLKAFGMSYSGNTPQNAANRAYDVYGINKDSEGAIWFGTNTAGAYRYDGSNFLWFGEKELSTLADGREPGVRAILEDKNGYFWLSNLYHTYQIDSEAPKGYTKHAAVKLPQELANNDLLYFNGGLRDTDGNLWMICYDDGLYKYDGTKLTKQTINSENKPLLLVTIYEDNSGTIWLGTQHNGLYKQTGNSFEKFELAQ